MWRNAGFGCLISDGLEINVFPNSNKSRTVADVLARYMVGERQ